MYGLLFYCVTLNASCSNSLSRRYPSYTFYLSLPLPKYYLYIIYIVATENSIAYVCTRISTNLAAIRVTISFIYIYICIYVCVYVILTLEYHIAMVNFITPETSIASLFILNWFNFQQSRKTFAIV